MDKIELIQKIEEASGIEYHAEDFKHVKDIIWNYYIDSEMFTEDEITLVTSLNGYNEETMNDMLFARFGYRDLMQYLESELLYESTLNENITEDNLKIVLNYVFNTDEDGYHYGNSFLYDIDIWRGNDQFPTTKPVYQTYKEMMNGEDYDISYKLREALQEAYPEYIIDYAELMGGLYDKTAIIEYRDYNDDYVDKQAQVPVQVVDIEDTDWDDETRLSFWA